MEMGDNPDKKQICRLCLDIVPAADAEAIEEKKKTLLDVLLINDLHVIENAVACSRCMEELQSGFEFKSACLHVNNCISTFLYADVPVDIMEVFHGEMRGTAMANVNLENRQICRLCMSLIADKALDCNADLKNVIANCLPEVDIHTVREPLVCGQCFSRMKKLNEFMKTCQGVERRINNYCQAAADDVIPVAVSLNDLLKFKDNTSSGLVKEECSNFDSNVLKDLKKEDIASIECEEIHIKTELGSGNKIEDSVSSGACSNSGKSAFLERKGQIGQFTSKERKHFSSDGNTTRHRGINEQFACQECAYKTDYKHNLTRHMVKHKDKSEVEMHKCKICEFETKWNNSMFKHMVRHRDPGAERKFKCDKCTYETNFKYDLRKHNLGHNGELKVKIQQQTEIHKCGNCEFESMRKDSLNRHMLTHRDPRAQRKFKCDQCTYDTNYKYCMYQHNLTHKDKSEVEMYKCANCEFETMQKRYLIPHMVQHRDPSLEREFKCDKCPYKTDYKYLMRCHMLKHKRYDEIETIIN